MKGGNCQEFDEEERPNQQFGKKSNTLPIWGNEKTMNLNTLILTNIQSSQYFKVKLYQLKTYHEVIDEIYYQVSHLEPWEKGSRKTSGQTGMCGGVRGVGAGGIVSTAYCILYKLYTLRLTRKQVMGLLNHRDSPYIRGLGFMYIRYTQPPADLWDWMEAYMDDEEEIDVRAGGGQTTTIGAMVKHMLTKLEWHATLFPRIPVPIQKDIEKKMSTRVSTQEEMPQQGSTSNRPVGANREEQRDSYRNDNRDRNREEPEENYDRGGGRDRRDNNDRQRNRDRERERDRGDKGDRGDRRDRRSSSRDRKRDRGGSRYDDKRHSRSRGGYDNPRYRGDHDDRSHRDFDDLLEREKYRIRKEKKSDRSRSRSRERGSRDKYRSSRSRSRGRSSREKIRHSRSRSRERNNRDKYSKRSRSRSLERERDHRYRR